MSPVREVEHPSLSACDIETQKSILIKPDDSDSNNWTEEQTDITKKSESYTQNAVIHSIIPSADLASGTTIRIPPMEWNCGGWDIEHFHPKLRLPLMNSTGTTATNKGIVITLEAMARECVAVALSPNAQFELGKTYAIHIGARSNLQTVIRRRLNYNEALDIEIPSPQICSPYKFSSYWIILQNNGQVSVGLGKTPGKNCIGTLDDSMYHALRSGVDAVKYVGLGNSALGRKARDLKIRNVKVMPIPDSFGAFGGIPLTPYDPSKKIDDIMDNGDDSYGEKDAALWVEYQKECEKAKKRAMKFGIDYKQPAPDAFFKWSEARRLRANPEKGFITGMNIMSTEEKEKARKRKERFEEEARQNKISMGVDVDGECDATGDMEINADVGNQSRKKEPLPMEQAWDNEELIGELRVDPPASLYQKNDEMEESAPGDDTQNELKFVPTKIHLFAIDWAAFKQIRTDDILSFFKVYGPTYVEWLGELSCNVHFEDKFSAARALEALSRALPIEVPFSQNGDDNDDLANSTSKNEDDIQDQSGETMQEDSTQNENADNTSVKETEPEQETVKDPKPISKINLGSMGWRFCNYPIRKLQSDRYGKKGSRSRCILRIATSLDSLDEKPSTWPKPPPGFTTKRVLGPGDDFKTYSERRKRRRNDGGGGKRRRRSRGGMYEDQLENDRSDYRDYDDDQPEIDEFGRSAAMDRGLSAGRAGFSVEQMEAERSGS